MTYLCKSINLPLNFVSPPHQPPDSLLAFWKQQRQQWSLPFMLRIQIPRLLIQQRVQPVEKRRTAPSLRWSHRLAPRNRSPSEVSVSPACLAHSDSAAGLYLGGSCLPAAQCLKSHSEGTLWWKDGVKRKSSDRWADDPCAVYWSALGPEEIIHPSGPQLLHLSSKRMVLFPLQGSFAKGTCDSRYLINELETSFCTFLFYTEQVI